MRTVPSDLTLYPSHLWLINAINQKGLGWGRGGITIPPQLHRDVYKATSEMRTPLSQTLTDIPL